MGIELQACVAVGLHFPECYKSVFPAVAAFVVAVGLHFPECYKCVYWCTFSTKVAVGLHFPECYRYHREAGITMKLRLAYIFQNAIRRCYT